MKLLYIVFMSFKLYDLHRFSVRYFTVDGMNIRKALKKLLMLKKVN